MFAEPYFLF